MYLKENATIIPDGLEQLFHYTPSPTTSVSVGKLCELYNGGQLNKTEIEIVNFLYEFTLGTIDQIYKLFNFKTKEDLKKSLDKLVKFRMLNKFCLVNNERTYSDDNFVVYCIDMGGASFLKHFKNGEDYQNWKTESIIMPSIKVAKKLTLNDFYLRLLESCPKKLKMFETRPIIFLGKTRIEPHFSLCVEQEDKEKFFVGEVVYNNDVDIYSSGGGRFREKAVRLESLMVTNVWKKNYGNEAVPTLLIIAEDDETALRVAEIIALTDIPTYRITTLNRMQMKLSDSGAFLSYKDEKLKEIKTKVFIDEKPKKKKSSQ
ncbi:MAG: hypothetical protein RSC93_04265 [Erysipelotrichaceae bacterium]